MKSGMKSGMSSESGMPNDKWPKSWPKKWPNHAEMILEAIAHDTTITVLELENQLPIGHSTIAKLLVALQTEGYLDRVKDNTGTHWQILDKK
jgi:predicted HTH transcriptional regulator